MLYAVNSRRAMRGRKKTVGRKGNKHKLVLCALYHEAGEWVMVHDRYFSWNDSKLMI